MVRSGGSLRPDELPKWQKALRQISVSECEFSKPVDQVFLIQTGTAPGDIHVADRLSQTSCLLHPDFLPQVKKISTLSDKTTEREPFCPSREFCVSKVARKPVAPVAYKNKLTVNRRRHLARVLSSLMCRCALFPSENDVSVSYMQSRLRMASQ